MKVQALTINGQPILEISDTYQPLTENDVQRQNWLGSNWSGITNYQTYSEFCEVYNPWLAPIKVGPSHNDSKYDVLVDNQFHTIAEVLKAQFNQRFSDFDFGKSKTDLTPDELAQINAIEFSWINPLDKIGFKNDPDVNENMSDACRKVSKIIGLILPAFFDSPESASLITLTNNPGIDDVYKAMENPDNADLLCANHEYAVFNDDLLYGVANPTFNALATKFKREVALDPDQQATEEAKIKQDYTYKKFYNRIDYHKILSQEIVIGHFEMFPYRSSDLNDLAMDANKMVSTRFVIASIYWKAIVEHKEKLRFPARSYYDWEKLLIDFDEEFLGGDSFKTIRKYFWATSSAQNFILTKDNLVHVTHFPCGTTAGKVTKFKPANNEAEVSHAFEEITDINWSEK